MITSGCTLSPHSIYWGPGSGVLGVGWIPMKTPLIPLLGLCWGSVMGIVGVGWIQTDAPLLNYCIGCILT